MTRKPEARPEALSEVAARRLSLYLRGLDALESEGTTTVSSHDFAHRFQLNSAQIRKDLANFGGFGIRGVGYQVSSLRRQLAAILGIDSTKTLVICGAGHLGLALAGYGGFNSGGFSVAALFDVDPRKIGTHLQRGVSVLSAGSIGEFAGKRRVDIGVIAVPADSAQKTLDALAAARIRAILNFAPAALRAPEGVFLKNVDLKIHLETLSFYLQQS